MPTLQPDGQQHDARLYRIHRGRQQPQCRLDRQADDFG
jgi:hypothetical protein